jgi:hypothetical protein
MQIFEIRGCFSRAGFTALDSKGSDKNFILNKITTFRIDNKLF